MTPLAPRAGVGLKAAHARSILETQVDGLWLEIHPENYMVAGGPQHAWLSALAERHALSFHGVGASLGGPDPIDQDHMSNLKALIQRYEPAQVSEHATWSAANTRYHPDLFALPRTREALSHLCTQVDAFQTAIRRTILLENPSSYLPLKAEMDEPDFLAEVCRRTGCGLLVDVNNIFISANNVGGDAGAMIDAIDGQLVGEVHLAGHARDDQIPELLIDSHGAPIAAEVWALFERLITRIGPRPTIIERDANIPAWDELLDERDLADGVLLARQTAI
jgi:hypothetical protein